MIKKYYEGKFVDLWIEENILFAVYKIEEVDLKVAKFASEERLVFSNKNIYPVLVDYTKVKSTTREARDYFVTEEASKNINAMAIIIESRLGKLIVNFYLNINTPKYPTKIFSGKEEAIKWLTNFKLVM